MSVVGLRRMNEKHCRTAGSGGGGETKSSAAKQSLYHQYKNSKLSSEHGPHAVFDFSASTQQFNQKIFALTG